MSIRSDYMKERRRIQRRIRALEKRGYTVDKSILPPIPKRPTKASINRLKNITAEKIYSKAKYTTPEGKTIKGAERRKQERRAAARKAAETRKERKQKDDLPINEADIIIERLYDMIRAYDDYHENTAQTLRQEINNAINASGKDRFAEYISSQDDLPELIEKSLNYKVGTPQHSAALIDAIAIIRGEPMTPEEMADINSSIDQDTYFNYGRSILVDYEYYDDSEDYIPFY